MIHEKIKRNLPIIHPKIIRIADTKSQTCKLAINLFPNTQTVRRKERENNDHRVTSLLINSR